MIPIKKWVLRMWFIDISFLNKGMWCPMGISIWRFNVTYLSRKNFVGDRKLEFFKN